MKIILLSTFYKPSVGGVERQVEEIFTKLVQADFDVKVYTTDASHSGAKRLIKPLPENNIKRFRYLFGFGYFFRFAPMLVINLLFADFDVLHVHNSHDAHLLPVILICLIRGKKLVLTGHNPYVVDKSKRKESLSKGVEFFDSIVRLFSFGIKKYIALLNSEKEFISKYLKIDQSNIVVIPNGIRDNYFAEIKPLDSDNLFYKEYKIDATKYKVILGCLCRMDFVKGIQNLEQAVKDNPDCLFIFAGGDGGYLNNLKVTYKDCDNVLFTEKYLNVEQSMEFYAFIDVFLLPSVYEPFGITIVEAMTQGKYILATSNGGPKEVITPEFGQILDPSDQQVWSNTIRTIKQNVQEYKTKGKLGIIKSHNYRWSNVIDKLIDVYNKA